MENTKTNSPLIINTMSQQGTKGPSGTSGANFNPEKQLYGIKKFHYKGKFPKPRNS